MYMLETEAEVYNLSIFFKNFLYERCKTTDLLLK